MHWLHRRRWLLMLAISGLVVWGALFARKWTIEALRVRMNDRYRERIAALSEQQAVRLIRRLGQNDSEWLASLIAASADERPAVAMAAEAVLRELVDRWAEWPPDACASNVANLAALLAQEAPQLPADRRRLAHALARRLIEWPVDGHRVDAARFIADCESVLLLPRVEPREVAKDDEPAEIRVAATPATPEPPPQALPPQAPPLQAPRQAQLPEARGTGAVEPQPFTAAGPMRISDD